MAEYVDRGSVLRVAHTFRPEDKELAAALSNIPADDVAPVVRCRFCRSYNKPRLGWCEVHLDRENPDDYCSYGKYVTNAGGLT